MDTFAFLKTRVTDRQVKTWNTLGEFIAAMLQKRQMSNRALASGAGVSESVIRNLLQHGTDPKAKDPDPRTLRAVADYLQIDALMLFRLAGYIPPPPNAHSVRADYIAHIFDRMPFEKQDTVLAVLESLADDMPEQYDIERIREDLTRPLSGFDLGSPWILRYAANALIAAVGATDALELERPLDPDLIVFNPPVKWSDVPKTTKERVLALAKAKLNLDYDPTFVDPRWRK